MNIKKELINYLCIVLGSILYAAATVAFIFPHSLLLGGTSGISVILNAYLPFSPGTILVIINFSLLVLAFFVLGRDMAVKTFVGSTLTTLFVGFFEKLLRFEKPIASNIFLSALIGAAIIAVASGIMFYVNSSSGGTDIIALIVRKYSKMDIGKALLITDVLIVIVGGLLSGYLVFWGSFMGLLVKTLGIDFVISFVRKMKDKIE
ncbi:MAG: YitT family protein [Clostridia bacterium]|nr:YitT family protein [Clostridia bacterium]